MARTPKSDGAEQVLQYIEDLALVCEQGGWPRIAGRILGWLLLCDPPHQDADQLAAALRASKASISTMTRYLIDRGFIERCTFPGDRKVYYRMRPGAWSNIMYERLRNTGVMRDIAERGAALLQGRSAAQRVRIEEMAQFYAWFDREIPALFERWEQFKAAQGERPRRR